MGTKGNNVHQHREPGHLSPPQELTPALPLTSLLQPFLFPCLRPFWAMMKAFEGRTPPDNSLSSNHLFKHLLCVSLYATLPYNLWAVSLPGLNSSSVSKVLKTMGAFQPSHRIELSCPNISLGLSLLANTEI